MNKIILCIKKFFAIIISFIIGIFHKDKKNEKINNKEEESVITNKKIKPVGTIKEDEKSTKSISNKNTDIKEVLYNAKKDIQKLMIIQKNIIDLEYKISTTTDLEDLYLLQKELKKEQNQLEFIASYYDKKDIDFKIIKDIKQIVNDSRKLIKEEEKNLDKKIYKEKNKKEELNEELKDQIEEEIQEPQQEENLKEIEIKKAKEQQKQLEPTIENLPIMELITIKEITEIISKDKEKKQKDNTPKEETLTNDNVKKNDELPVVTVEKKEQKKINTKKEVVNKQNIETNLNQLKKLNKSKKVVAISLIISRALSLVQKANINSLLIINPLVAVNSSLMINNEIRRARSITDKKVKKLKLDKVVKKVGNNPKIMVKAIMNNSLSEIRRLKAELKQYDMSDELVDALNNLNEMELDILSQIQEMENMNNLNNFRTR